MIEWSQTATALELRRVARPGATEPQWNGGQLLIENGTGRARYNWAANSISVSRTNQLFPALGPMNVRVQVVANEAGVSVDIRLQ